MSKTSYKSIFKSTFLFAFVRVFNIFTKIIVNKAVAIFLGTSGLGIIGIYQTTISLIATFFGFGISKSAIRDISANTHNIKSLSKIISTTNYLIFITSFLGSISTIFLSTFLSKWAFGNQEHIYSFMILSIAVFFTVLSEGKLAVLTGMRQLNYLARASIFGCIFGVSPAIFLYYFFQENGIIPSIILVPLANYIFSIFYIKKMNYKKIRLSLKKVLIQGSGMFKMGLSLMYVSLWVFITEYLIKIYISATDSIQMVGLFQAGSTLVMGYFGIITTSMATEYYPRISAIYDKNKELEKEVNKQSKVGLVILGPLVILFLLFTPFFVELLYSTEFLQSINYIKYAIFGVIIIACSNPMGMILLAKQKSSIFLISVTLSRLFGITASVFGYSILGLKGLGLAYLCYAIFELISMKFIMNYFYKIKFETSTMKIMFITLIFCSVAFFIDQLENQSFQYMSILSIFLISLLYSWKVIKKEMHINISQLIKNKIKNV